MNLSIIVIRKKKSYQYKRRQEDPDSWGNNDANNMLDEFTLWADEALLLSAKCQTVANIPGGRWQDTIAPGPFQIRAFVEPRLFHGRIHGICHAYDLENEYVDSESVQENDKSRWLIHDTQKKKPNPPGEETRVAWSAGCFVLKPSDLEAFNTLLDAYKIQPGDLIDGELRDEGEL